ncbi:DUF1642 domain-containing protein [Lactovum odontotermitis]
MTKFEEIFDKLPYFSVTGVRKKFKDWEPPKEKPEIPSCIADFIEKRKYEGDTYIKAIIHAYHEFSRFKTIDWIKENDKTFIDAWYEGYTITDEKLYYVKLPHDGTLYTMYVSKNGRVVQLSSYPSIENKNLLLTEQEIKAIDKRYWEFRVPVEEE